jgi:hypothetical protein
MKKLSYKVRRPFSISGGNPANNQSAIDSYMNDMDKLYKDFIGRIKSEGGYIEIRMTADGFSVASHTVVASEKILDALNDANL